MNHDYPLRSAPLRPLTAHCVPNCASQKLSKLAAPSPFELTSTEGGKRKIGENKLLSRTPGSRLASTSTSSGSSSGAAGTGRRYSPYALPNKCKDCRSSVTQNGAKYCHSESLTRAPEYCTCTVLYRTALCSLPLPPRAGCAYKKGICSICSKQIVNTTMYTMSTK